MQHRVLKTLTGAVAGVTMMTGAAAAQDVTIGWTAWSDAEFVTKLAKTVMEERMDQEVELVQTDIAPQYQGVANGDIDAMLMSWLPATHADYMDKVGGDVVNLGILYTGAKLGWAVPNYIPEDQLSSIEDLKNDEVREKLDGKIQGIDPGAGLMRLSNKVIDEDYELDYNLVSASGAAMTAALDRAISRDEWIVVTGWSPHWMFGAYDLRYLEDPKGTLGGPERVHAIARQGFYQDNPEAAGFLSRMSLPIDDLQAAMYDANENGYQTAVDNFIEDNEARVNYWVTGDMPSS
ncbi:glycine betaine ABC transporter substrate-binding protein [Marivibrio halodurans]|uniref:Glycine betaine ABC transporter substrate-binding protein n=1 Tax=Marivibrio halodurans TaxID=2039722 RepID=A0A8J7S4L7_9PROT|nr:glycine betaine ABC transporter substrate-binding protein [Marivibrio halodurans]MBP5855547.1 glycine betaine ABC transporter substrate-binding protein [Marivibrio halodurans]